MSREFDLIDDSTFISDRTCAEPEPKYVLRHNRAKELADTLEDVLDNLTPGPKGEACTGKYQYFYDEDSAAPYERRRNEVVAKRICSICPIVVDCLEGSIQNQEKFGIWGGTTEKERKTLIIKRRMSDERDRSRSRTA